MNLYKYHSNPKQLLGYNQILTSVPELAYEYAKSTGERFPEGEDAIASSSKYAYWYAKNVIEEEWPKGEDAIASRPQYAYWYARNVIKGRFLKGERALAENDLYAYLYAKNVLDGPWPQAEKTIKASPLWADYETEILKIDSKPTKKN